VEPFLIPDDFRAFMQEVVRYLDASAGAPELLAALDAEDALQHETGYGGRAPGGRGFRFTYLSRDGREKWLVDLAEAAIRDIADGLLIEVMGERLDIARDAQRDPKGHPLLIWGEHADDALVPRDRAELLSALDVLHELAGSGPRMLRLWSATDDQIVAMLWRNDCALYVVQSQDGYASSCGYPGRTDSFELVDYDGQPFAVPYHDCVPWSAARDALLRFVERGDLGPGLRTEGRIPTGLLMMGDVGRDAVLGARAEPPRTVARTSLPRMMAAVPGAPPEETVDEEGGPDGRATLTSLPMLPASESSFAAETDVAAVPLGEDLTGWAHRLIELLCERGLLELGQGSLDELADQLGGLLQAHGSQAQHSLEAAEWLAREIGAIHGIGRLYVNGGDLQVALRRTRAP
jgi:hypothetical protein